MDTIGLAARSARGSCDSRAMRRNENRRDSRASSAAHRTATPQRQAAAASRPQSQAGQRAWRRPAQAELSELAIVVVRVDFFFLFFLSVAVLEVFLVLEFVGLDGHIDFVEERFFRAR